jgi:hypothetical protein
VGPGPRVKDWAVGFCGGEEAHYRRQRHVPHAAVHLLRTRRPTPEEYDLWARAPVPEAGLLLLVEAKRHLTAGSGMYLTQRFTFSALGDQRTSCMTCGAGAPRHWLGTSVCIGGYFPWRFEARAGESAFKKGFIPRVAAMPSLLSHLLCPFASELSAPLCLQGLCFASLDGARWRLMEGSMLAPSTSAVSPPGSSCSLLLERWHCRSRLLLAVTGGA